MLKVKKAYMPKTYENKCFVKTLDGRTAFFITLLPPVAIKETDLHYCSPACRISGRRAEEIISDSPMGYWLLQYKVEIDGGGFES